MVTPLLQGKPWMASSRRGEKARWMEAYGKRYFRVGSMSNEPARFMPQYFAIIA
jgi:hypothetical protein